MITFPQLSNNRKEIEYVDNIRTLIYKKLSNNSYREHLILDKWLSLNPEEYVISREDCDLFLRIVRQIILNSRDEQAKIADIYSRIEKRNFKEQNKLYNHISKLNEVIETQQTVIKNLCEQLFIDPGESLQSVPILHASENDTCHNDMLEINKLTIPQSGKDARFIMYKFLPGLICPSVHKSIEDGYSYVLPSDVLPIAISSGLLFEHIEKDSNYFNTVNKRSIFQANYIQQLVNNFKNDTSTTEESDLTTLMVPLGLWSDGCDAGSASKANRNLVKLTTLHFVNPQIKEEHVFPVALGEHNANHDYVRNVLMDDLYTLSQSLKKCYVPSLKKLVQIKFFIAYYIQDRVEHCEFTGFSGHNGVCSTIPGLSCPIVIENNTNSTDQNTLVKPLQSCDGCFRRRFESIR